MGSSSSNVTVPKDVVLLHQFPRAPKLPSASPFVLKLETWIRMANIPYNNAFGLKYSSKGKMPWIELNGKEMTDSQFIIENLTKYFNKNLNENLSDSEMAASRAYLKLTEESLYWCLILHRFVFDPNPKEMGLNRLTLAYVARNVKKSATGHGYGRHSKEEVYNIGRADIKSLSTLLGQKKFLFGDKPCDLDAAVFGLLAQFVYTDNGPFFQFINSDCKNLIRYVNTIKEIYWEDWDQCINKK